MSTQPGVSPTSYKPCPWVNGSVIWVPSNHSCPLIPSTNTGMPGTGIVIPATPTVFSPCARRYPAISGTLCVDALQPPPPVMPNIAKPGAQYCDFGSPSLCTAQEYHTLHGISDTVPGYVPPAAFSNSAGTQLIHNDKQVPTYNNRGVPMFPLMS